MLTLKQAKELKPGDVLHQTDVTNSRGAHRRWKVNGQVKTWKRDRGRIRIPLKHGLRSYDALTESDFVQIRPASDPRYEVEEIIAVKNITLASQCECGNPY